MSQEGHAQVPHREGSSLDGSEQSGSRSGVLVTGGQQMERQASGSGSSGSMHPVEWKSRRAPRVTRGTAKLEHRMVGALSSYSPRGAVVPLTWRSDGVLIRLSRFVVLGVPGPSKGVPVISPYSSLDIALDITHDCHG